MSAGSRAAEVLENGRDGFESLDVDVATQRSGTRHGLPTVSGDAPRNSGDEVQRAVHRDTVWTSTGWGRRFRTGSLRTEDSAEAAEVYVGRVGGAVDFIEASVKAIARRWPFPPCDFPQRLC